MPKIYLAGPITGCTYDGCTDWRNQFAQSINMIPLATHPASGPNKHLVIQPGEPRYIKCLDPMRAKSYLKSLGEMIYDEYPQDVLSCQRGIMTRDFFDCTRCDLVFVNLLGATRVSIGTVMEIAWAFQARIPVVAAIEETGNLHDHGMIREAIGFRLSTLEDAARTIRAILG